MRFKLNNLKKNNVFFYHIILKKDKFQLIILFLNLLIIQLQNDIFFVPQLLMMTWLFEFKTNQLYSFPKKKTCHMNFYIEKNYKSIKI